MTKSLDTKKDSLEPAARAHVLRLFGEIEAAQDEMQAVERERRRRHRTPGSSFHDLSAPYEAAIQKYDRAAFALELALGAHPNEAAAKTLTAIREQGWREQRKAQPAARGIPLPLPNNVIPLRRLTRGFEPSPEQQQRGYLRPAELADALSVSRGTLDKLLKKREHIGAELGIFKSSDGRMSHWRIPLDAPDRLKRLLSGRDD